MANRKNTKASAKSDTKQKKMEAAEEIGASQKKETARSQNEEKACGQTSKKTDKKTAYNAKKSK